MFYNYVSVSINVAIIILYSHIVLNSIPRGLWYTAQSLIKTKLGPDRPQLNYAKPLTQN